MNKSYQNTMLPALILLLATSKPVPLPNKTLEATARTLALDEGYPIDQPGYTFDRMDALTADDGFDSIGLYLNHHMIRMYSIHRTTGDIVDFMHGCVVFRFDNLKPTQLRIRRASGGKPMTDAELKTATGCPVLQPITAADAK